MSAEDTASASCGNGRAAFQAFPSSGDEDEGHEEAEEEEDSSAEDESLDSDDPDPVARSSIRSARTKLGILNRKLSLASKAASAANEFGTRITRLVFGEGGASTAGSARDKVQNVMTLNLR